MIDGCGWVAHLGFSGGLKIVRFLGFGRLRVGIYFFSVFSNLVSGNAEGVRPLFVDFGVTDFFLIVKTAKLAA